ncbi:MAG: hypothetical protein IT561_19320 [Alphaproteobacteria bacterium]|nr:hypothetical protein [Alphaproteobacteria bacterium]
MQDLFRRGAFQGRSPREAWFVRCEGDGGGLTIVVGFAPLKPAEFVVVTIRQRRDPA